MGIYLYAIAGDRSPMDLGECGLPAEHPTRVIVVPGNGVSAVVSKYRGPAVADLPRPSLLRSLAAHQRVGERAMAKYPILPVKFGTILASLEEVQAALEGWQEKLSAALSELGDAKEIEVVATWDLQRTFAEIACQPEIAALAAATAGRPAEETLASRIEIGRLVKESLERRREEYRERIVGELSRRARDVQVNPILADQMVANVALLVERAGLDALYDQVSRLDEGFEGRLNFRCIGPLPPHSFATVEVTRPDAERIEAARRVLHLGERVCGREITAAYRRLAAGCHPDLHPGDPTAPARFAALATAHDLVQSYLSGQPAPNGLGAGEVGTDEESMYDVSREAIAKTLSLSIKRSGGGMIQTTERDMEMMQQSPSTGTYIYCIGRADAFDQAGAAVQAKAIGEAGDVVRTVTFMNLAAIVSDSSATRFDISRANTMAHQVVIEEAMRRSDILPVRFSTVAKSDEAVRERLLKRRFGELHGLLNYVEGRVELGLKVFWNRERLFGEVTAASERIRTLRDAIGTRPAEEMHYERIQLGQLTEEAINRKRERDADAILESLRPLAGETKVNKILTDMMVLNAAFLVERSHEQAFDATVNALDRAEEGRLLLKYVGPLPPYNFVNLVVRWEED